MRVTARLGLACALFATAAVADTPLALDPGLWKMSATATLSGAPPAGLQSLPPAQRAAAERAWREHTDKPVTHELRECVTAQDIRDANLLEADEGCKRAVAKASASEWTVTETCTTEDGTRVTNFTVRALSRRTFEMRGTTLERGADGERRGTMAVDGQWLAAQCPAE